MPRRRHDDVPRDQGLPDRRVHEQLPSGPGGRRRHPGLGRLPPGTRTTAITTVVIDRVTALACLVLVAWIALAVDPGRFRDAGRRARRCHRRARRRPGRGCAARPGRDRPRSPAAATGSGLAPRGQVAARACVRPAVLARTAVLGIAFEALVILALWLVASSIGLDVSYSVLAVVLPPVLIVSALPISIAGYGVREASFVVLLSRRDRIDRRDAAVADRRRRLRAREPPGRPAAPPARPAQPPERISRPGASGP